jgi:hypothetical protein
VHAVDELLKDGFATRWTTSGCDLAQDRIQAVGELVNPTAAQHGLQLVGDWIREHLDPELKAALERRSGEIMICMAEPRID